MHGMSRNGPKIEMVSKRMLEVLEVLEKGDGDMVKLRQESQLG